MSNLVTNAQLARQSTRDFDRILIVTGDDLEARFWDAILNEKHAVDGPKYWVERGKKGNLLGALQAYTAIRDNHPNGAAIDQILMLFGSGTRLSPFTQSLRNIKAAFPLPDGSRDSKGITIGEAAIRSTTPLVDCLHEAGFSGVVVSWGDEVLIPSRPIAANSGALSEADVVRFGWRKDPDKELAAQKEWLQVDMATGTVVRDISRQPFDQLAIALQGTSGPRMATFVNLGSLAATHEFLSVACDVFGKRVADESSTANWDPYFWQALQCPSQGSWDELVSYEQGAGLAGLQALLENIPDFFEIVRHFRMAFERRVGRPLRVSVLDFGEPYWIDVGNHAALSSAFSDLFSASQSGTAIRAFLGLPDSLATGANFIADSNLPNHCKVNNSIVIGTTITDEESTICGAVVLGSNIGRIVADRGASVVWCRVEDLRVDGPNGIGFRLDGHRHVVLGDESATTLLLGGRVVDLKYAHRLGNIDHHIFETRLPDNPVSFSEAAALVRSVDPIELHRSWAAKLAMRSGA
jgi:hypothetical protein